MQHVYCWLILVDSLANHALNWHFVRYSVFDNIVNQYSYTLVRVAGCDRGSVEPVDMEMYPASPRKYPPYDSGYPPPVAEGSARVCVITSVVVDTPSVVVCSVDVEPCSVLSQSIVHTGVQNPAEHMEAPVPEPLAHPEILEPLATPDDDGDVMDRICHDLDYLLGGLPQEIKAEIPRPEETVDVAAQGGLMQQTSL